MNKSFISSCMSVWACMVRAFRPPIKSSFINSSCLHKGTPFINFIDCNKVLMPLATAGSAKGQRNSNCGSHWKNGWISQLRNVPNCLSWTKKMWSQKSCSIFSHKLVSLKMAVIIILWVENKDQAFSWFSELYYNSTEFFEYPQNLDASTYLYHQGRVWNFFHTF